ncbi:hypothetical protein ACFQH6_15110 [Halobacteriaceae archaeon GCM10025711]
MSTVDVVEHNYTTTNTTEMQQLIADMAELRQEVESREPTTGATGTETADISMKQLAAIAAVLLGLTLLVQSQKQH